MVETISGNAPQFTRPCDKCGIRRTKLYVGTDGCRAYCEGCFIQHRSRTDGAIYSSIEAIEKAEHGQAIGVKTPPSSSTAAPTESADFLIKLDLDTLEEKAGALRQLNIQFDQVESMVCLPQDRMAEAILTGAEMEEVIGKANEYLDERGDARRFREEFWEMPPATRRDLMELMGLNSDWTDGRVLNEINPRAWEKFQQQQPEAVRTET